MSYEESKRKACKFLEGDLEHKKQDKWVIYWCVLRGNIIYIFSSKHSTQEIPIGTLEINGETRFNYDKKESFKFELKTSRHINKFKTKKNSDRELWRAYIIGISTGSIPDDLDLLPGQIKTIGDEVLNYHQAKGQPTGRRGSVKDTTLTSGFSDGGVEDIFFEEPDYVKMTSPSNYSVYNRPRFYKDINRNDLPSWFFANCSRELAEKILSRSREYGNTLMRESITFRETGSFTITKVKPNREEFDNFEVKRIPDGYKINVTNAPEIFCCLSDLMEHFVKLAGPSVTKLLSTNNLKILGFDNPYYTTKIFHGAVNVESGEADQVDAQSSRYRDGTKTLPNRGGFSSFHAQGGGGTDPSRREKQTRPGLNIPRACLPAVPPVPVPPEDGVQFRGRAKRAMSAPHVEVPASLSSMDINVPLSSDPGLVKKPTKPHLSHLSRNFSDAGDSRQRTRNSGNEDDNPYRPRIKSSDHDPRQTYSRHSNDSDNVYQNYPQQSTVSPRQNLPTPPPSPARLSFDSESTRPTSGESPSALLGDIQKQLTKLKRTESGNSLIGGTKTPPPVAPKTKPLAKVVEDYLVPTNQHRNPVEAFYEEVSYSPNKFSNAYSSSQPMYEEEYYDDVASAVPFAAGVTSPETSSQDNCSSGSARDVRGSVTSSSQDGDEVLDKNKLKQKLEMLMGGGGGPAKVQRSNSCRDMPLPDIPKEEEVSDDAVYEEIPADKS